MPFFFFFSRSKVFPTQASVVVMMEIINPFDGTGLFQCPMKTEFERFSDIFR